VKNGGGLIATGSTSLYNELGEKRPDFALSDLFGAHIKGGVKNPGDPDYIKSVSQTIHTYLRLRLERRKEVYGPQTGKEPAVNEKRHPILKGFEETDILPFGGLLNDLSVDSKAQVLLTFVPEFPVYPPETAWMRDPVTSIPGLILNETSGGRVAFLPADIDRRFGRDNLPDHWNLLVNLVKWASKNSLPLKIKGAGLIDSHLYQQENRLILHLVNLTSAGTWRAPVHELIPVGPLRIKIKLPDRMHGNSVKLLTGGKVKKIKSKKGWLAFRIKSVLDHEVIVIG
jgi:hypothetical protein